MRLFAKLKEAIPRLPDDAIRLVLKLDISEAPVLQVTRRIIDLEDLSKLPVEKTKAYTFELTKL